jgi:hypothetical protein
VRFHPDAPPKCDGKHRKAVIVDVFADQVDSSRGLNLQGFTRHSVHDNIPL